MVVFDDIQWGEETFLDLVEQVALLSQRGAAASARAWRGPSCSSAARVAGRAAARAARAATRALLGRTCRRELGCGIAAAAGGNPLFVTEMIAMAARGRRRGRGAADAEGAAGGAARPARVGRAGRARAGAVEGELFHRGAVQALEPEEAQVAPRLAALVRRELIRPDRPLFAGRGRLPLLPPADPRRRLRRASEGDPGRAARAVRRLARPARRRARRARRDPRLPPPTGPPLPHRARADRPGPRWARR